MPKQRYKFNQETLAYEVHSIPLSRRILRWGLIIIGSFVLFSGTMFVVAEYYNVKSPKEAQLERNLSYWYTKLDVLAQSIDENNKVLEELQLRDNTVYRPIFGMEEISQDIRNAGFGGVDRYSHLASHDASGMLTSVILDMDILTKKVYVQSRSYDDVSLLSQRAEEMSYCVPRISPVAFRKRKVYLTDRFGMRINPVSQKYKFHAGIDIGGPVGEPIYSTGNGVVERVAVDYSGYGKFIIVDHGFGYKTRYAHLKETHIKKGDIVKRGDIIGELGNSGSTTGPHLHYEVIYRNMPVDPLNYFNRNIELEDYYAMVRKTEE